MRTMSRKIVENCDLFFIKRFHTKREDIHRYLCLPCICIYITRAAHPANVFAILSAELIFKEFYDKFSEAVNCETNTR